MAKYGLGIGDVSDNGQVTIVDEDRLCYLVQSECRGAKGLRTISKKLLKEFVEYVGKHPDATPRDARNALSGTSDIDKYEYGYDSTLVQMAKMSLNASHKYEEATIYTHSDKANRFALLVFKHLYKIDKLQRIRHLLSGQNKRKTLKESSLGITMSGVFIECTPKELKKANENRDGNYRFFNHSFNMGNENLWYLTSGWSKPEDGKTEPTGHTIYNLKLLVEHYYDNLIVIVKDKDHSEYILKDINSDTGSNLVFLNTRIAPYFTAIKSKPFLLLAGISGTGKSRIVREFAFKSCPKYLQDKNGTTPGNYCMIEVKPNWHDSTELLGYYSRLGEAGYQFTKFVKFLVKAKMFPKVPFFVCLDEMNLAPVEQYFAEILSILETRKHPKDTETGVVDMGMVKTEPIIDARYFRELSEVSTAKNIQTGETFKNELTDRDIYLKLFGIDTEENIDEEVGKRHDLTTEGLTLPDNVIIIGTVNMDDTTHQFSRKVIDRAMTIEMNGGNLRSMFGGSRDLEYLPEGEQEKWQNAFTRRYVTADEVLEAHSEVADKLMDELPARLETINNALKGTPFEVSYRVLNEFTIMVGVMLDENRDMELDDIINQALNNILLMKILPRIEGDVEMFALSRGYKEKMGVVYNNRLEWLKELAPDIQEVSTEEIPEDEFDAKLPDESKEHQQTAKEKIQEMTDRLNNQEYTRFWP